LPTPEKAAEPREKGIRRLAVLLLLLPLLAAGGAFLGSRMAVPLSRMNDTVQLAERMRLEETGRIAEPSVETDGYRRTKEPPAKLYARALEIRQRIGKGGWVLGGFMGLVIGGRMVTLGVRRRRKDYVPHRGECVSCARCFRYCPKEQQRVKKEG
jgi:hypothetical protein